MTYDSSTRAPFFTVAIPLFNKEKFVARAIDSVLGQSFGDFELLVIDDGSTDSSAKIVEEHVAHRTGCSLIRQLNSGVGATRSACLKQARGRWVAFLDADDAWQPNHLKELARIASICPEAKMIATGFTEINEGQTVEQDQQIEEPAYCNYFLVASEQPGRINSSNVAIHSKVPPVSGYFGNARSGQDLEYWVRVALEHKVALSTCKTSIYYRGNWGNMEKLASTGTNHSDTIGCLADVSATLGLLEKRWLEDSALAMRNDIQTYVNARLDNAIRIQFVRGNFESLASLRKMKFSARSTKSRALSGLAALPLPLLSVTHTVRELIKRSFRFG